MLKKLTIAALVCGTTALTAEEKKAAIDAAHLKIFEKNKARVAKMKAQEEAEEQQR